MAGLAREAQLPAHVLPEGLRLRRRGDLLFALNYDDRTHDLAALGLSGTFLLGSAALPPSGVAVLSER